MHLPVVNSVSSPSGSDVVKNSILVSVTVQYLYYVTAVGGGAALTGYLALSPKPYGKVGQNDIIGGGGEGVQKCPRMGLGSLGAAPGP